MEKLLAYGELPEVNNVRIFIVNREYEADYNVFFVHKPYEERNTHIITPGELVDQEHKADVKVLTHTSILNSPYEPSDVARHQYLCGFERT
jgi:hypothetical protein